MQMMTPLHHAGAPTIGHPLGYLNQKEVVSRH